MNRRTIFIGLLSLLPTIAFAEGFELVKCGVVDTITQSASEQCGYPELIQLVQDTLSFLVYTIATPIAALMFGYAGFQMITSQGDMGAITKAKKIFTNVLIGYGVMLAAFLIIKLIFSLIFPEDYSLLT